MTLIFVLVIAPILNRWLNILFDYWFEQYKNKKDGKSVFRFLNLNVSVQIPLPLIRIIFLTLFLRNLLSSVFCTIYLDLELEIFINRKVIHLKIAYLISFLLKNGPNPVMRKKKLVLRSNNDMNIPMTELSSVTNKTFLGLNFLTTFNCDLH